MNLWVTFFRWLLVSADDMFLFLIKMDSFRLFSNNFLLIWNENRLLNLLCSITPERFLWNFLHFDVQFWISWRIVRTDMQKLDVSRTIRMFQQSSSWWSWWVSLPLRPSSLSWLNLNDVVSLNSALTCIISCTLCCKIRIPPRHSSLLDVFLHPLFWYFSLLLPLKSSLFLFFKILSFLGVNWFHIKFERVLGRLSDGHLLLFRLWDDLLFSFRFSSFGLTFIQNIVLLNWRLWFLNVAIFSLVNTCLL